MTTDPRPRKQLRIFPWTQNRTSKGDRRFAVVLDTGHTRRSLPSYSAR